MIVPKGVGPRRDTWRPIGAFAGDFAGSEGRARTANSINPKAAQGYLVLAEAQMGLGQIDNASQSYHQLGVLARTLHLLRRQDWLIWLPIKPSMQTQ